MSKKDSEQDSKNQEDANDPHAAYMPYDILEEEEEDGESMLIVVSRGAGVVVREVSERVSRLLEDKPKVVPTRRADSEIGPILDALGKLVAEHEEVGYHKLEKNAEFGRLISQLSRRGWRPRLHASSRRRDLRHKRKRAKQTP